VKPALPMFRLLIPYYSSFRGSLVRVAKFILGPGREYNPTVKSGGTPLAAATRSDPDGGGRPFDHFTEADFFIADKTGEPHAARLRCLLVAGSFFRFHGNFF
jgi:hypothetical protein